ncbi:hypothetical protein RB195_022293 [Necator americanus]|uniref:Uncharacterized protein n=1 Tax=Necator americanus TaxID=51031 RepID=A0ABR1EHD7_NECAM
MERLDCTERKLSRRLLGYFWPKTEAVKEDLRTLGVDRQFRRDVRFRRIWNSDEWIDSVQVLAEDREGWAELCSRTAHLGEDAETVVRQEDVAGFFLFNFAVDDIMQRAVEQCPANVILASFARLLARLEYADDVVTWSISSRPTMWQFGSSSETLLHVVNLVLKFAAAYRLGLHPDKCEEVWVLSRPSKEIRVDEQPIPQPIELVNKFCEVEA